MPRYEFEGKRPRVGADSYVHPQAVLIGDVTVGAKCYVGAGAVLRGDMGSIVIGSGSSFQDNAIAHGEVTVGDNALIAHGCVLHSATLGEGVTLGVGSIVMDGCLVGDGSIVGAGALLLSRTTIPPAKIVFGSPASVVGDVSAAQAQQGIEDRLVYQNLAARCFDGLREIEEELPEIE